MAKTFVSNKKEYIDNIRSTSCIIGFSDYSEFISPIDSLIVFKKLKVKNENFLLFEEGYISVSGTFIYDGFIGNKGLKKLFSDFTHNMNEIRKLLVGNYLICIKKNNKLYIFGDENNIYNINYYNKNNIWMISNSLFDIVNQIKETITINEMNLLEEIFQNAIIDNGTIFNDIKKLMGSEYIIIDLTKNIFTISSFKKSLLYKENQVEKVASIIKEHTINITDNFKNITVSMTGGLDSRIVFSSFMSVGIKPNTIYGVGNSVLTSTLSNDLLINKIYEKKFQLNFTQLNWSNDDRLDKYWTYYQNKYGISSRIYGGLNNFFKSMENLQDTDFVDFGYFGETLRNIDWLEELKKDIFSLDEYLDNFYINMKLKEFISNEKYKNYREHIYHKLFLICKISDINHHEIHKNDFQKIHNEYRKSADNVLLNFINYNFYSINLLSINEIEKSILNIPFEDKLASSFIIKLIDNLYPNSLDIPIFSHCKMYNLSEKNILSMSKKTKYMEILKKTLKYVVSTKNLGKIRKVYRSLIYRRKRENRLSDKYIENFCINKLQTINIDLIDEKSFVGDVRHLFKYTQMMTMINNLLSNNKKV